MGFKQIPIPAGDVEQTYADISKGKEVTFLGAKSKLEKD
jgi:hypothetical protein